MKGPKVFGLLILGILGILLVEHLILSRGENKAAGFSGTEAPPLGGAPGPSTSTLTHGRQVDVPETRAPNEDSAIRRAQEKSHAEFAQFLRETAQKLPTKDQAKGLDARDTHGHPAILTQAAAEFGEIAERLERDPSLRPQGLEFYQQCALNAELFRSVRALCFNRAQLLHADLYADIWHYDPAQIPKDVIELAKSF